MKNIFRLTAVALLAATLFSACTGAFEDMNTNPKGVSDEELKQDNNYIGMHFIPMMQSIYYNKNAGVNVWEYQLIQNLNADLWSGYISTATAFAGNVSNVTYAMNAGWNDNCWDYAYRNVMVESLKITNKCKRRYGDVCPFRGYQYHLPRNSYVASCRPIRMYYLFSLWRIGYWW